MHSFVLLFCSVIVSPIPHGVNSFVFPRVATRFTLDSGGMQHQATTADNNEDNETAPGEMRVSEIKAELDLRTVSYADCFDKDSLVERLTEARATGKADPEILEKFNKQNLEQQFDEDKVELLERDIEAAVANDGTLPGGLTPDQFKKMAESPELMTLLKSTKMQEAMALMMTGGREELENKIKEDPELQEIVKQLDNVLNGI